MAVGAVTDSTTDIPPAILRELDITVALIYGVFGEESYHGRVDIGEDEFCHRLSLDGVFPTTAVPSPRDSADVYNKLAEETGTIHLTSLDGTRIASRAGLFDFSCGRSWLGVSGRISLC